MCRTRVRFGRHIVEGDLHEEFLIVEAPAPRPRRSPCDARPSVIETVGAVEIALCGRYGQGKIALVDERFADAVRAHKWYLANGSSYAKISGETIYLSRYILALATVPIPSRIDHVNQDRLDCRLENLKPAR